MLCARDALAAAPLALVLVAAMPSASQSIHANISPNLNAAELQWWCQVCQLNTSTFQWTRAHVQPHDAARESDAGTAREGAAAVGISEWLVSC